MKAIVFVGPTVLRDEAMRVLDATYCPPVAQGDVLRAAQLGPPLIGIIDGFFEGVPAVWHKEILYALTLGIPVLGSASMGALRAAELWPFGMEGVGSVFEAFRDGRLEDDDEVAVTHGPAELGYPLLSEAMVDIRRTLSDAVAQRVISCETQDALACRAKRLHYKDRSFGVIISATMETGEHAGDLVRLRDWLPGGRVSQKRLDAVEMLKVARERLCCGPASVSVPRFYFERTALWERSVALLADEDPRSCP